MKALQALARFIRANDDDDNRAEIRVYARENAPELAAELDTPAWKWSASNDLVSDDAALARRLASICKDYLAKGRASKHASELLAAQQSADVLADACVWTGESCAVDMLSVLATCLTRPTDRLAFLTPTCDVSIPMRPLRDLARIVERVDLTATLDAWGLHVRWKGGRAGVNVRRLRLEPETATIPAVYLHVTRTAVAARAA